MSQPTAQDATHAKLCDDSWQRAERLATTLAEGDLAGGPLYLLRQSRMSTDLGTRHHYAFTHPRADLIYRDHITNWLGRGPCAVINDMAIVEDFDPQDQEYITVCITLHELAHIVDRPVIYDRATDEACTERAIFDALVLADFSQRPQRADLPLYFGHELSYIRAVLHLAHRATAAGYSVSSAGIFNGCKHGLSPTSLYEEAIGDEPKQLADQTIRQILASPPPVNMADLWMADLERYSRRFTTQSMESLK
jgi:hypothetical protein